MQLPRVLERQGVDRPVALRAVVLERMRHDGGPGGARDLQGAVGRAGIHDVNVVAHRARTGEGRADRGFGIEGEDDDRNRHHEVLGVRVAASERYTVSRLRAIFDQANFSATKVRPRAPMSAARTGSAASVSIWRLTSSIVGGATRPAPAAAI